MGLSPLGFSLVAIFKKRDVKLKVWILEIETRPSTVDERLDKP
jgi:hypothetical protein